MKRRKMLSSLVAAPAVATALPGLAAAAQSTTAPAASTEEFPKLTISSMEDGAGGVTTFFTAAQLAALAKLADAIMPAGANGRPGANQAGVVEFLDFLVRQSPAPVQALYREGLDRLATEGVSDRTLAPLKDAWTYSGPPNRFAQFLQRAKLDIFNATVNSREWSEAQGRGRRGSSPSGYYWRSLD